MQGLGQWSWVLGSEAMLTCIQCLKYNFHNMIFLFHGVTPVFFILSHFLFKNCSPVGHIPQLEKRGADDISGSSQL